MIVYTLCCEKDHEFEAWFRDSDTADAQIEETQVVCPVCGTTDVRKALMSPRLAKRQDGADPPPPARQVVDDPGPTDRRQLVEALRALRRHVETNCDYVGDQFAEEARRIHYGEVEHRDIYGETTSDEANSLRDEGIDLYGIPWLPRHDS